MWRVVIVSFAISSLIASIARAQTSDSPDSDNRAHLAGAVTSLLTHSVQDTSESLLEFLSTLEVFNAEAEIDRMVGDPWELYESTAYKLSLLPYELRYPIYRQMVQLMARQDQVRRNRIENVGVDSVDVIAIDLDSLDESAFNYGQKLTNQVRDALASQFSAEELVDLGFFLLAQQSFFPATDEGWRALKHKIVGDAPVLAVGALVVGATVNLGALNLARPFVSGGGVTFGWYAGVRRFGFALHPEARAGLTLRVPHAELALGTWEKFRPGVLDASHALELAFRAGWLDPHARPDAWDLLLETAVFQVTSATDAYRGPRTSGRAGLYAKRYLIPWLALDTVRASVEIESGLDGQTRFAASAGVEDPAAGVAMVLQLSHAPLDLSDGRELMDTRLGGFVTWTIQPWTETFVAAMDARSRLVMDDWEAIAALDRQARIWDGRLSGLGTARITLAEGREALDGLARATREREALTQRMAGELADYLEMRRHVYMLLHRARLPGAQYGPLDPSVTVMAGERIFAELADVARALDGTPARLEALRRLALGASDGKRAALEVQWRHATSEATARIVAYRDYRGAARRILKVADRDDPLRRHDDGPVGRGVIRQVQSMLTLAPR